MATVLTEKQRTKIGGAIAAQTSEWENGTEPNSHKRMISSSRFKATVTATYSDFRRNRSGSKYVRNASSETDAKEGI
ncbi:MAG: hypothetical protein Rhob2KO_26500 [Rhodopirellula baltica]